MRGGPWHIFHFIGHGGFDRQTEEGLIFLADEAGESQRLTATSLGRLMADHRSLRLVILNSCEGARGSERDLFSSTASILVRRGLPAVLAMQYEITDRAAIEFSRAFYEAVAEAMPVDATVSEARKAVSFAVTNTVEWGTPVLHMRSPNGRIFDLARGHVEKFPQPKIDAPLKKEEQPPRSVKPPEVKRPMPKPATTLPTPTSKPRPMWRHPVILLLSLATLVLLAISIYKNFDGQKSDPRQQSQAKPRTIRQDSLYAQYRQEGDDLFRQEKFDEAKNKFEAALKQKPGDPDATERIKLCDQRITAQANAAEREKQYLKYKNEGDAFFSQGKFETAKLRYQDALAQKPGDAYVSERINACDQKIAHQETATKRDKLFAQYRDAGDAFFNQGEYAKAKNQYEQARSYKADDRYVANRIQECNNRLVAQTPKQETAPPGMVLIRGGSFLMGSNDGDDDEKPVHQVYVDDFYLNKYEVTVVQYAQFLQANPSQTKPDNWNEQLQHSNHPAVYVSWEDAIAFCEWLGKLRGKQVRLPTEAEWEYAARSGLQGKKYPWGDEINHEQANYYGTAGNDQWDGTSPVGSFPANGYGLHDMAGNVWEWCSSLYIPYPYKRDDGRENLSASGSRVLRGGSWSVNANYLRCADRDWHFPTNRLSHVGFRCAQDVR